MLDHYRRYLPSHPTDSPVLLVVIDTEEEFDWGKPLSRSNVRTRSIAAQGLAQQIFKAYGIVPTYVADYPVVTEPSAVRTLRGFVDEGTAQIGAHLHPWVNPPHVESVTPRNSYPGNLPASLEYEKLARLSEAIQQNFNIRPTVYKAGRYGIGKHTPVTLERLGYHVDLSVVAYTSFVSDGGPDFSMLDFRPFVFGSTGALLEIPLSCGYSGVLRKLGRRLYPLASSVMGAAVHLPGILARTGLLERIRLTPEGVDDAALRRLTQSLLDQGCRTFCLAYHSPSLVPGNTPYVRDAADLKTFLQTMDRFFDYFFGRLGGTPATPEDVRQRVLATIN